MALTAKLDIDTPTGAGDVSCAIDPDFWAANQSTIQGYASAAGVTLYYQDSFTPGSIGANINTLADAQYQITRASNMTEAGATGPAAGATTAAAGSSTSTVVAVVGGLGLAALLAWWLLRR